MTGAFMGDAQEAPLPVRRPDITYAVTRGAARFLRRAGYAVVMEMPLAIGRRVDIMALSSKGELIAIEVKSGREDFAVDRKWLDYSEYCDGFAFAVAPDFPVAILPEEIGLIVADAYDGEWVREPVRLALAPARRKAMTIAFARLAALRLHAASDPQMP
ncbi:MAG: DNA repair putative endonuclease MmcB [Bosea sp. (in: a-proteobacteria)]